MSQVDADFEPRTYRVRHTTRYIYDDDVTACYERGFLSLRPTQTQRVRSLDVRVDPEPELITSHGDFFGNESFYVEVRTPHTTLDVTMIAEVEVDWARPDPTALDTWTVASAAAELAAVADPTVYAAFTLPSTLVALGPEVAEFAAGVLAPDRPLGEALTDLVHTIYTDFAYRKDATSVRTTLPEVLALRAGVCQDFAHLAIGALRTVGLPARYVSGYIETAPPPGKVKLEGSDATHAWASVLVPGLSWVDLDPTNDHVADSRYVVTAWGRDFRDVSPLKGVLFTESTKSSMSVAVDVTRLPG